MTLPSELIETLIWELVNLLTDMTVSEESILDEVESVSLLSVVKFKRL